jgi:enoyl-CoA hydratase
VPLILTEIRDRVGLITLNRPEALNAINGAMIDELVAAIAAFDADDDIGAIVVTGSARAFAAGADVKEMASLTEADAIARDYLGAFERIASARKPIIAAVSGYCFGGGMELAMICDIIVAAESASFRQPEITLAIIPGMGGTQRLPRAIGKAKAMDLILTGRAMDAAEAERTGLVARVVPTDALLPTALAMAAGIAAFSLPAVIAAKEAVNRAFDLPLGDGVKHEKRRFYARFASADQKEGMAAFAAKRPPKFSHR